MKNTLMAVALFGAFGAASAQSSVTVYGVLDAGITNSDASSAGSVTGFNSGSNTDSHLGFKGTEDLGNGLKALFVLEQGFDIGSGNSSQDKTIFGRQAYVGLASDTLGTIKLGRQESPMYNAFYAIDPFSNRMVGSMSNTFANGVKGKDGNVATYERMNNTVNYTTPSLAGFSAQVAYGFGEQAGDNKAQRQIGASVGYANGPLNLVYAYHNANLDTLASASGPSFKSNMIGGTYDFNVVKLHMAYDQNKQGVALDTRDLMVGATIPVGKDAVFGDYTKITNKIGNDTGADVLAIGYQHNMSKRTNLYAAYSYTKNEANATYAGSDVAGQKVNAFQVGLRHAF